jgi:hypothetical protein
MVMRRTILCLGFLLLPAFGGAQQTKAPDVWGPYKFLLGTWTAEGHGEPGEGKGAFSFRLELQGKILVRRSHVDYPATPKQAAFTHEDLLVIYPDAGPAPDRAIYFDSEGHNIHYAVTFSEEGKVLTFASDPSPESPRFRLIYNEGENGTLKVKFQIAPPGKPEAFVTHVEGVAHREGIR